MSNKQDDEKRDERYEYIQAREWVDEDESDDFDPNTPQIIPNTENAIMGYQQRVNTPWRNYVHLTREIVDRVLSGEEVIVFQKDAYMIVINRANPPEPKE